MMDEIKGWAGLLATVLSVVSIVYAWITSRSRQNTEDLTRHETKLTGLDRRVQKVENDLSHLPDRKEFTELTVAMTKLSGQIGQLEVSLNGVNHTVRRIDSYLDNEKRGS